MLRILQILATSVAALALLAQLLRPRSPELSQAPSPGVTYSQLARLVVLTILLALAAWLSIQFARATMQVLTLVTVSIILTAALRPLVDRIEGARLPLRHAGIPRALAILLLYLVLVVILMGIGLLVIPQVVIEAQQLMDNLPKYVGAAIETLEEYEGYPFVPKAEELQTQLVGQIIPNLIQAINLLLFAVRLVAGLFTSILVLVLTFFLLMDAESIHEHTISLFPPSQRGRARTVTARMGRKIEGWLRGIILLSLFIGIGAAIGMWAIGMPYPILLGLMAGLFELVPLVGAYLGAAPAVILALFQSPWMLAVVVAFFFALQQIENSILAPVVMGREVHIPPLLAIVALLLGAALLGIIGALLALPVAAVVQVLWVDVVVPAIKGRYGEE